MTAIDERLITWLESRAKRAKSGCLEYQGSIGQHGYARVNIAVGGKPREYTVPRLIAHFYHGLDLSQRFQYACHHCDNPICINKDHIYVGDPRSNTTDAIKRGRFVKNGITTHCPRGHEYTAGNTGYSQRKSGFRQKYCRTCKAIQGHDYSARRRQMFKKLYGTSKPKNRNKSIEHVVRWITK